jgi:hypothetical protein
LHKFWKARVLQTILDDGYLSPDDAKMLKTLNYSDDRIREIGRRFRMDVLNDGSCKAAVHHRAAWIVHNMSDSDNSYSLQRSYLYELAQSAPYNAPCVFEGKVNDWFTDSIFEMFDVSSPVVRDARGARNNFVLDGLERC